MFSSEGVTLPKARETVNMRVGNAYHTYPIVLTPNFTFKRTRMFAGL